MDKESHSSQVITDMGQIHPKMNWEGLAHYVVEKWRAADLSASGMACLLPQILPAMNLEIAPGSNKLYTLSHDA